MERGYFALWRKFQDHVFWKERREFSKAEAWIDILWNAQWKDDPQKVIFGMTVLIQNYGECLKSNRTWATRWGWSEPKARRFLKLLSGMKQITLKSEGITTRLTVLNFNKYDPKRLTSDAGPTQQRRSSDAAVTTNNKDKKEKKDNNKDKTIPFGDIVKYLNQKSGKNFNDKSKATRQHIRARWNDGFGIDDFKRVIDIKCDKWLTDEKMVDFIRPQTLFAGKFEAYLNEAPEKMHSEPTKSEEQKWLDKINSPTA